METTTCANPWSCNSFPRPGPGCCLLSEKKRDLPPFVTRSPWISSYEAKILFVKNGKYKISMYEDPKLHDYRQYEANLPIFVTSYSRDPLNLKLKSQNLNIGESLTFTVLKKLGISM
ncbi:uncharacterized protein LOC133277398 [Pezoporus flaviventris]|uniref:uncharacterized protein LOC133277398 n=1 Tax=Pezoporus flaviventris TaxID=889875 RepID=UPI002AB01ADE|nr:uncharacterized protein LOC133277398 [Pezoporus flaviventris]